MGYLHCPYVKRDGTVCGNVCWRIEGCHRHWKLIPNNSCTNCRICGKITKSYTGNCALHASPIYAYNYRNRQKNSYVEQNDPKELSMS